MLTQFSFISLPKNNNHKRIGLYYLLGVCMFVISGLLMSIIIRLELYSSGNRIINKDNVNYYNLTITLHGLIMIFFVIMPGIYSGIGNYSLPMYCNMNEIALPRANNMSYILFLMSFLVIAISIILEFSTGAGWTIYPPLSIISSVIINIVLFGLILSGLASLLTSVNYILSMLISNITGIELFLNVFLVTIIVTAVLLIIVLPILTGVILMLLSDLTLNTVFFVMLGDPVLYQHLFWIFGHPEVYVLILPAFGIINLLLSSVLQKLIFGIKSMILAIINIGILGNIVWAHHMFTVGLEIETLIYFTNITLLISLPTGTKIYNWLCMYLGNNIGNSFKNSGTIILTLAIMFIIIFVLGGVTGIVLGNNIIDITLHDSYYVIAHFHYILSIGAVLSLIAGFLLFQDLFFGLGSSQGIHIKFNSYFIYLLFTAVNLIFTPLYFAGFNVMPRRILDYPDYFNGWNYMASIGSQLTIFAVALLKK